MCSPSTMTWHIKWRARDWTSCFSPSRFSLADHELASTSQMHMRKNNAKNLSPSREKCDKKRQPNNLLDKEKERVLVENKVNDDSIRALSSSDENYIVFSFREDGEFDVVYDCKSAKCEAHSNNVHRNDQSSRRVNRKLDYGEGAEQVSDHQIQESSISNANQKDNDQQDQDYITTSKEDEEKETKTLNRMQHRDNIRRSFQIEDTEDSGMVPRDSRDSNLSEGSRGSFAFPVLGWEIIGSPVKMPKSEDMHLKKQKIRCVRFQCFRF